jgi:hypothetical protein
MLTAGSERVRVIDDGRPVGLLDRPRVLGAELAEQSA